MKYFFQSLSTKLSVGATFEKFLHQSIQSHARSNSTKFEVLTSLGSSVFQIFVERQQLAWSVEVFCMNGFRNIHGTVLPSFKKMLEVLSPKENIVSQVCL